MKLEALINKLNNYKAGTFVKVTWERDVSSAKAKKQGISITKECVGLVRVGINYNALKALQGVERSEDRKPSWFEHCEESKGLIQSKNDSSKKYLQVFTVPGSKIKSTMITNGQVEAANVLYDMGLITKAALSNNEELHTFTLNVENIKSFGK